MYNVIVTFLLLHFGSIRFSEWQFSYCCKKAFEQTIQLEFSPDLQWHCRLALDCCFVIIFVTD
jgi:hypothetical protein